MSNSSLEGGQEGVREQRSDARVGQPDGAPESTHVPDSASVRDSIEHVVTELDEVQREIRISREDFLALIGGVQLRHAEIQDVEQRITREISSLANMEWKREIVECQRAMQDSADAAWARGSMNEIELWAYLAELRRSKEAYHQLLARCIKRYLTDERRRIIGTEVDAYEEELLRWFAEKRREAAPQEAPPAADVSAGEVMISAQELADLFEDLRRRQFPFFQELKRRSVALLRDLSVDDPRRSEKCRIRFANEKLNESMSYDDRGNIRQLDESSALAVIDAWQAVDQTHIAAASNILPAADVARYKEALEQIRPAERQAVREWFAKKRGEQEQRRIEQQEQPVRSVESDSAEKAQITLSKKRLGEMCKRVGRESALRGQDHALFKRACSTEQGKAYSAAFGAFIREELNLDAALPKSLTHERFIEFLDDLEGVYQRIVEPHIDGLGEKAAALVRKRDRAIFGGERQGAERMFAKDQKQERHPKGAEAGPTEPVRITRDEFERIGNAVLKKFPKLREMNDAIRRQLRSLNTDDPLIDAVRELRDQENQRMGQCWIVDVMSEEGFRTLDELGRKNIHRFTALLEPRFPKLVRGYETWKLKFLDAMRDEVLALFAKKRAEATFQELRTEGEKLFAVSETTGSVSPAVEVPRTERTVKKDVLEQVTERMIRHLDAFPDEETRQLFDAEPDVAAQRWDAALARVKVELARLESAMPADLTYARCQRCLADFEGALYPARAAVEGFQEELRTRAQEFLHGLFQATAEAVEKFFVPHSTS